MKILTLSQIRAAEESAVNRGAFSFAGLMKNAADAFCKIISEKYEICGKNIVVVAGNGNNGGDGVVIAHNLKNMGAKVLLYMPLGACVSKPAIEYSDYINDIKMIDYVPEKCDILIDALFGIGLNRELSGTAAEVVSDMNMAQAVKISVDIPSGIDCNGKICKNAFCADDTVTFIALKPCFVSPKASDYCGEVTVADIGVKPNDYAYLTVEKPQFKKRLKNSHKGTYGTALLITGSYGMCGAQILSAKAALATGVGIAKAIVCDKNYTAFCSSVPEAVTVPVDTNADGTPDVLDNRLFSALFGANAILLGCGLGCSDEARSLVIRTLSFAKVPVIIDADGINCIANDISILSKVKVPTVITPHPKEMARLCKTDVEDIESNRFIYAKSFAQNNGCVVVLKGPNTVIASPDGRVYVNINGNCGLATGGSGDVLSGIIVSRLAQGDSVLDAALKSVWLHGNAADNLLERYTKAGMLPSDIIEELKKMAE